MHFHYRVTLRDIFDVFVLLRRMTLWPWLLTFWPWECLMYSASHVWCTYQFFIILLLSVTESRVLNIWNWWTLNIWSHFSYLKQSLRMRRVTWPLTGGGGKNSRYFWNPWPKFVYSLCHFHGATTKIKPCYRRFPIMKATKFTAHHVRSPKTTRNNFLTPNCQFTIKILWGYDDDWG